MFLLSPNKSLQAKLGAIVASGAVDFGASYIETNATANVCLDLDQTDGELVGTTPVVVVAAPAATLRRQVKDVWFHNGTTAEQEVIFQNNYAGTVRDILTVMLPSGATLYIPDGDVPRRVPDASGDASSVAADLAAHEANTANPHATTAVQVGAPSTARQIISGAGLTGGGDLSADRTIAVGAGSGITVAADAIAADFGTSAGKVTEGNDARLSDARTPTAHATSHESVGGDAIKLDDLAAPDDNTDLNASITAHGLLKKLSNVSTEFMNGAGNWATPASGGYTEQTTSATGTQNDFSLSGRVTYLRCTGAAPLFTGFTVGGAAPTAGDTVIIDRISAGTAKVAHQNTGSTAANRVIAPSTNGQIVGEAGRMMCIYDGTTSRWREACIDPGVPIDVAFTAGDFTGQSAMTWTVASGDLTTFKYQQNGTILSVWLEVRSSSVGGTPAANLLALIPGGFTASLVGDGPVFGADNGTFQFLIGGIYSVDMTKIRFALLSGNWALATDTTWAKTFPLIFPIT